MALCYTRTHARTHTHTHAHTQQQQQQQQPPLYGHYTGQRALASTSNSELVDFVVAKFYCLHALADGNQSIRIREKTLEFSSTVLSTLSSYIIVV